MLATELAQLLTTDTAAAGPVLGLPGAAVVEESNPGPQPPPKRPALTRESRISPSGRSTTHRPTPATPAERGAAYTNVDDGPSADGRTRLRPGRYYLFLPLPWSPTFGPGAG